MQKYFKNYKSIFIMTLFSITFFVLGFFIDTFFIESDNPVNEIVIKQSTKSVATLQEIGLDAKAPSATLYIWTKVPDGHTSGI